jgi:hypothetical protein
MAIKELFYDNRPRVLLDPRASQRIDPRFTFTRASTGTYIDANGLMRTAAEDEPRIDHDFTTGEPKGLLLEPTTSNGLNPFWPAGSSIGTFVGDVVTNTPDVAAPDGTFTATKIVNGSGERFYNGGPSNTETWTMSIWARVGDGQTGSFGMRIFSGPSTSFSGVTDQWRRYTWTRYANTSSDGTRRYPFRGFTSGITWYVWGSQYELNAAATSNILYGGSRSADLLSINAPLPTTGSVYIDARASVANQDDTLLSLKNDSNDKIDLAYLSNTATYNSLALIANYDGTSKSSLPLPVPTTDRERNIITYGANNYQYGRDSSRFATSLSSSVPTGLNKLSIGHDAVDATKAFHGYINTVYAWSGELTPEVAKALVRGEIDAINADTYSPTGPAGSLALVINTQGTAANGEKTFTLPAESVDTDNDIVITWGDGTESGLDGAAAELGAIGLTHDYPSAGIYPVWVEGKMQNIKYNNNISNKDDLLLIAAWGTDDMLTSPSTMNGAFYGCSQMDFSSSARTTNKPNTSAVTDWTNAFRDCSSITGTFPAFNFSAATNFGTAWSGCSSMSAFVAAGDQTQNVTSFTSAWYGCNSLTSFPLINTSSGTNFSSAWYGCNSLTSFPLITTSSGTDFGSAWYGCSSLTSFPLINTSSGTSFSSAWRDCSSLTSFPLINTSSGTSFSNAWRDCSSLTSFPLITTSSGTNFTSAWYGCNSLTSFPLINTSSGTSFSNAWRDCSSLTSFPLITTSSGTDFGFAWRDCSSLTSFPLINTSSGTSFSNAWYGCSSLTSFPLITTSSGTNFTSAWYGCSSLTSFPLITTSSGTDFGFAWRYCSSLTSFPLINTSSGTRLRQRLA